MLSNSNSDAIIIYGSYGRGEGAWILKDQEILPYNDFDIVVITDNKISNARKNKIIKNLQKKINTQWIDLQYMTKKTLGKINKKTIFNYDLKFGSTVIDGDKDILEKISIDKSDRIDINDLEVLFNTRLWALYGSYKNLKDLDEEKSIFFKYQMSKAILATVDSYLIRKSIYEISYKERVKLFININQKKEINDLVEWALKEKLFPSPGKLSYLDASDLLKKTKRIFFNEFFQSLSEIYGIKIKDIEDIILYRNSFKNRIKRLVKYVFKKEKNIFNKANLRKIEIILGFINTENDLSKVDTILKKYSNDLNLKYDNLESLRAQVALKRFNI